MRVCRYAVARGYGIKIHTRHIAVVVTAVDCPLSCIFNAIVGLNIDGETGKKLQRIWV